MMRHAWSRRLITIPVVYLAFIALTFLLPVVLVAGAGIDASVGLYPARRQWPFA